MSEKSMLRGPIPDFLLKQSRDRGLRVDPGLPVQPSDPEGSERGPDIRPNSEPLETRPPLRSDGSNLPDRSERRNGRANANDGERGRLSARDDGGQRDGAGSERARIRPFKEIIDTELANVADRYRNAPQPAAPKTAVERIREGDEFFLADDLKDGMGEGIAKLREVMSIPLPDPAVDQEGFNAVARIQIAAAQSLLGAGVKTQGQLLQARRQDLGPKILDLIAEQAQKLRLIEASPHTRSAP